MIDRLKIWIGSKPWYWQLRTKLGKLGFVFERAAYKRSATVAKATANARILGSFTWIGLKSLFWVALGLAALIVSEGYIRDNQQWLSPLSSDDKVLICVEN
ncbi:hypothetical protein ACFFUT_08365 [Pseudohalocynthiibacter aestuariivivens]|uniref:Uncharacterized protein n=1 Tax=Pseudohalocynthiibacter aestuariivivens TaxID=1591409 RepID=A0ABV5JEA5_9RHOB|nr:hypothetical protein [Pseudohalocynthiibacter aestuariivivens]MBS9718792.1 hypothetical protein [Pseudohalocynthiibacter aestuariivivens]